MWNRAKICERIVELLDHNSDKYFEAHHYIAEPLQSSRLNPATPQ
jgi:hypothetical protein